MSLKSDGFDTGSLSLSPIGSGTSILLTGEDTEALQSVFSQLVAADDDERSIVLSTNNGGRAMQRDLNSARTGAGSRASVLTREGPAVGDDSQSVDDISDLTRLGMDFSTLVASAQQHSDRFRSGIKGLQTSFKAHIEVEKTGPRQATLTIDGLDGSEETVDVPL